MKGDGTALCFLWDTESYSERGDADAQEATRANAHGAVGVNALFNPLQITLAGRFLVSPEPWAAEKAVSAGCIVITPGGLLYQCARGGTTDASEPTWGGATVTDGTVTWTKRATQYECLRGVRDLFDDFFHAGILRLYLDDDRYIFAQCVGRNFPGWDGLETSLEWDATFSCFDPRKWGEAENSEGSTVAPATALWTSNTPYTAADTVLFPSDSARKYECAVSGRSGPAGPVTPWSAPVWAANRDYGLGDYCRPGIANGLRYRCTRAGTSGSTPPTWPVTGTVDDPDAGGCQWTAEAVFADDNAPEWQALTAYPSGAVMRPDPPTGWLYVCTRAGTSGATMPTLPETEGATVDDPDAGGCRWTAKKAAEWEYADLATQRTVTLTVEYAGNAPGEPTIRLTVPAAALDIAVANLDTAQEFVIRGTPDAAGDLDIDCAEGMVTLGGADAMHLFDGEFLTLAPGTNRIRAQWNEPGPTVVQALWRERWW